MPRNDAVICDVAGRVRGVGRIRSVEPVVRDDREEFAQVVVERERREDLARVVEVAGLERVLADVAPDGGHLVLDHGGHEARADLAAVIEPSAVTKPLPELRPGDLRGRDVFHQVVQRDRARTAEPRGEIANADADVEAESILGARSRRDA